MADRVSEGAPGGPAGVVVMAYGTPSSTGEVEAYYTDIRRGRPPTPEQLADLVRRYDAIGGVSPLAARTQAQVAGLAACLGDDFVCTLGQKHAAPRIEEAVDSLLTAGCDPIVGLVLAPHYSALSVGQYHDRAVAAIAGRARYAPIQSWHLDPVLIGLLAERVSAAISSLGGDTVVELLVTAHSLPERVRAMDDPYETQLQETAQAVAEAAGVAADRWRVAWQSAGRTPEPWLGPDILEVVRALPAEGVQAVVVCPAGFTSDHLEVLYDVDIEARRAADAAGLALARTASLNDEPRLMAALAERVRHAVELLPAS